MTALDVLRERAMRAGTDGVVHVGFVHDLLAEVDAGHLVDVRPLIDAADERSAMLVSLHMMRLSPDGEWGWSVSIDGRAADLASTAAEAIATLTTGGDA